jgi:acetate---CoA ligase (ADP-forming)
VPLPANLERVERAVRSLRGAPLLDGGRGRPALDVGALARLAQRTGELLLEGALELIELNPVLVFESGAIAVDAAVRRRAERPMTAVSGSGAEAPACTM